MKKYEILTAVLLAIVLGCFICNIKVEKFEPFEPSFTHEEFMEYLDRQNVKLGMDRI